MNRALDDFISGSRLRMSYSSSWRVWVVSLAL